jgi:serine/threonine protein kinase
MRDKIKRNFVCVKIIKIKNIPKKEREATKMEVDLLKRLHHPNIVGYIDSFLSKNHESLCICMEYCDGVSFFFFFSLFSSFSDVFLTLFRVIWRLKLKQLDVIFFLKVKSFTGLFN